MGAGWCGCVEARKVDVRLPGKGNPDSHGARPVHLVISMMEWIRTSRLSIQNSLSVEAVSREEGVNTVQSHSGHPTRGCIHRGRETCGYVFITDREPSVHAREVSVQGYLAHKKTLSLGPYSRHMPRALWWS